MSALTGRNIIDLANSLLDESGRIDDDLGLTLANLIKDVIEGERQWEILKKRDTSLTVTPSDTWETAKSLSGLGDFLSDRSIVLGNADKSSFAKIYPIGFEQRELFKDSNRYCIDYGNSQLYILGTRSETYTIYLYYIYQTDDLTLTTSPVWPMKFHKLIPLLMAELHAAGVDYDEIEVKKALEHNKQASALFAMMVSWNTKLVLQTMNHSTPAGERPKYKTNQIPLT